MDFPDNPIVDILTAPRIDPEWLVEDFIVQGDMVCMVGESGAGKSNVAYTIGLGAASGCAALGGLVPKGPPKRVLYFDDENSEANRDEYLRRAWCGLTALNGKEPDLGLLLQNFWPLGFQLGHDDWPDTLAGWVHYLKPHLVVIDTANACFNIEDENNNAEAIKAIRRTKQVMRSIDPKVSSLILKHAKTRTEKGQVRTMRGAKVWKDQADSVVFQVKSGGRPRRDGLSATRLIPDKTRAFGLQRPLYITPRWTDDRRSGLLLEGSFTPTRDHRKGEDSDDI